MDEDPGIPHPRTRQTIVRYLFNVKELQRPFRAHGDAAKKKFSAVVVKAFKSFFQMFSVPDGEFGESCGVLELQGHQYGAWPDL